MALTIGLPGCASAPPAEPDRWEPDIQAFEAADREQPPAPGGVVFVGSSSIRMWDTLQEDFEGLNVINRGFGGSEMADAVRYLDRIVLPYQPRVVVVYAGDNDLWAGKTPGRVLADFRALVRRIHEDQPETRIAFIAIKPSVARWTIADQVREANQMIQDYAESDPRLEYIDVFTPMLGEDGMPRPELFIEDGLHLNPSGYDLWESVVEPVLRAQP